MNRTLSFQQHVESVVRKVEKHCNLLACLGNTGWEWKKCPTRSVYLATQRSILDYAAPAWQPWIARTQMDRLERAQNQALRRITGQTASSPVEDLRIEAGLPSDETISRQLIATSREKAFRCPPNHPRRLPLEGEQRHRLCRDSWRESSKRLEASLPEGLTPREPLAGPTEYLWTANPRKRTVSSTLVGGNRTDNAKTDAIRVIRESEAKWVIYTDGSASEGTHFGGSAMVVTQSDPENPVTIDKIKTKGRIITSSYEEEKEAMESAIKWLEKNTAEEHDKLLICTDSQSLTDALDNESPDVASLCRRLDAMDRHIDIQWVPGHMDIRGNELADKFPNQVTEIEDDAQPTSMKAAKAVIKRTLENKPPSHARTAAVYANHSTAKDEKTLTNRRDAVMLARLRAGYSMKLAAYRHLMDPTTATTDPRCPKCFQDNQTLCGKDTSVKFYK